MENINTQNQFSETEDTKLKRFLSGSNVYIMLVVAIISALVFIPSFAAILKTNSNIKAAESIVDITELDLGADLSGQYVEGSVYKFVAQLGYIAESKAAAEYYYYLMYIDIKGEQYAVLAQIPTLGTATVDEIVQAYLTYAKDPSVAYAGNILEISGRFKEMTKNEEQLFETGISQCAVKDIAIPYTLKFTEIPTGRDTVKYYFFAVPFGIAMIVCVALFFYGQSLEKKREEANKSPYPYLNRKKK